MYVASTVSRQVVGVNSLDIEITADDDSPRGGQIRNDGAWRAEHIDNATPAASFLGDRAEIQGVSCPTRTLCVAFDDGGNILSSAQPAGGAGAWKLIHLGDPPTSDTSRACRCRCASRWTRSATSSLPHSRQAKFQRGRIARVRGWCNCRRARGLVPRDGRWFAIGRYADGCCRSSCSNSYRFRSCSSITSSRGNSASGFISVVPRRGERPAEIAAQRASSPLGWSGRARSGKSRPDLCRRRRRVAFG
jgi:hypothetical protein